MSHALAFPIGLFVARLTFAVDVPGTFLSESACALALGDSTASPANVLPANVRTPATATANKSDRFMFYLSLLLRRSPLLFTTLNTPVLKESLRIL